MSGSRRLLILAAALVPLVGIAFATRNAPFLIHGEALVVGAVGFSSDGQALATVCYPQSPRPHAEIRVWDLATGRELRSQRRIVPNPIVAVTDNGQRLFARTEDGGTRPLSDLTRWPERILLDERVGGTGCTTALSRDGCTLATARFRADLDRDTRVQLWDTASGRLIQTLDDGGLVDMLAFSPDGKTVAGVRRRLAAWDVASGSVLGWSKAADTCVPPLAFAPDGLALVVQGNGSKINLVDSTEGRAQVLSGEMLYASALAFAPDGRRLAVAENERVTIWDLSSHRQVARFEGHVRPRAMEEVRREFDNQVRWIAGRTRLNLSVLTSVANDVWSVAFSADGRLAASCDLDGTARVWDTATGNELQRFDHRVDRPAWPVAAAWIWAGGWGIVAFMGGRPLRKPVPPQARREPGSPGG